MILLHYINFKDLVIIIKLHLDAILQNKNRSKHLTDLRMNDGQSIDPHSPPAILVFNRMV